MPESLLYPIGTNPGDERLKIGVPDNNSTATLVSQIQSGSPRRSRDVPRRRDPARPNLTPPSITFDGNPGLSAGIKDALVDRIGRPA